jgi:hypothetical protein
MHRYALALLIVVSQSTSAFAAELPKEGSYDYTACWSGVSNIITFSKTHTGSSYELMGAIRSNPPGGMFDKNTFRCVGMGASLDGKITGAGKVTRTHVAGTGKFEGMVMAGTVEPLGPFKAVKEGTFQDCNRQTGTYKLK